MFRRGLGGALEMKRFLLLGVKYEQSFANRILRGVHDIMTESSTHQAILKEGEKRGEKRGKTEGLKAGELRAMRKALSSLGEKRFGEPTAALRGSHRKNREHQATRRTSSKAT